MLHLGLPVNLLIDNKADNLKLKGTLYIIKAANIDMQSPHCAAIAVVIRPDEIATATCMCSLTTIHFQEVFYSLLVLRKSRKAKAVRETRMQIISTKIPNRPVFWK